MILQIDHRGTQFTVDVGTAGDSRAVRVEGKNIVCDWVRLPDGGYSLIIDGQVYDLCVDLDTDACIVTDRSGTHPLRILDPRSLAGREPVEEGQSGLQRIRADMPGKVMRLLVKPGDSVGYDQGLLVLEAMKMQNEIRSPKSGVVREIGVQPGATVGAGDFLVSLE